MKAISIDSTFADAYAGLADLYDSKSWSDNRYNIKRDSVVNIAYRINPNSAYVLMTKGLRFRKRNSFNLDSVFSFYKRAHTIDPSNIAIKNVKLTIYWQIGLYENSIDICSKIIKSNPMDSYVRLRLAQSLLIIDELDGAKEEFVKILEINPDHIIGNMNMFYIAIFYDKDKKEAETRLKKLQSLLPDSTFDMQRSLLMVLDGEKEEALSLSKSLSTYSLLDMKKEGSAKFDSLYSLNNNNESYTYMALLNDKKFDFIRDMPAFREILAKAKKVHEERVAKYGHLFD